MDAKSENGITIKKIVFNGGGVLENLMLKMDVVPLPGFIPVETTSREDTLYINRDSILALAISDDQQPMMYDFIGKEKVIVREE